jgi:hypothetical protein
MWRITGLGAWVSGAAACAVGYWYVAVYLLEQFNHGYGRDTWFAFNIYLCMLAILTGLVGYGAASFSQPRPRTSSVVVAGVVFMIGQLVFVFILGRAFPDHDLVLHGLVGAVVIGAFSMLVTRPNIR